MSLPKGWVAAGPTYESGQAFVHQVRRRGDSAGSLFALKRLKNAKRKDRFAREVKTMDRLRRENAVAVPEIVAQDLDDYRPWFVMPWHEDGSLELAVNDGRHREDVPTGLTVLIELAQIISDVHAAGTAHRDIKPSNVLLGASGLVLTDFGLCLEVDDDVVRLTGPDEAVGSRLYIAPENEAGINDAMDQRPADAYAFGKLTWALLAGRQPLPREAILEPANRLETRRGDSRLASVDRLLRDLLNRDPRARLADWAVVIRDLRAAHGMWQGIADTVIGLASERAREIAGRLAQLPQISGAVDATAEQRRREVWWRQAVDAMRERSRIAEAALRPLQQAGELLTFKVTTGGAPSASQLAASGVQEVAAMASSPPAGGSDSSAAVCFVIHSPQGIAALPTLVVRVWMSGDAGLVSMNRVPMLTRAGQREEVADFLAPGVAKRVGPLPALRQATVDDAVSFVEESARLFVSLSEHYLDIVDRAGDPGTLDGWRGRDIVPAPPISIGPSERGDTKPPELRSFEILPSVVDVRAGPVAVVCRARIIDDFAGVAGEGFRSSPSQARLRSVSGQFADAIFDHGHRISGDALDGVYEDGIVLTSQAERGKWSIEYVLVVDQVGNSRRYSTQDLQDRGLPIAVDVR